MSISDDRYFLVCRGGVGLVKSAVGSSNLNNYLRSTQSSLHLIGSRGVGG
jgi:hypothetical protein